jgi:(p)ppGpp synthase/HD superfamily hydrolase
MQNIYFNGSFDKELGSKYLTIYTNCIIQEKDAFVNEISASFSASELNFIEDVINLGRNFKYGNRLVDEYYFSHALRIARFVYYNIKSENLESTLPSINGRSGLCSALSAALLHNCFEKNLLSTSEFSEKFGEYYTKAVELITVDREAMKTREGIQSHYLSLSQAPIWVLGMRALDKADNLLVLHINPDELTRKEYLQEIKFDFIPILTESQSNLAQLLKMECDWAETKNHEIPTEEQLNHYQWSYRAFAS